MIAVFTPVQIWTLDEGGQDALGLSCSRDGLFLGGTALIEMKESRYVIRSKQEIDGLIKAGYGMKANGARLMSGLRAVAAALAEGNFGRARIAAVHLQLPLLRDKYARLMLETEDLLLKFEQRDEQRTGTPPNPGWFAPTDEGADDAPAQVAQNDKRDRAGEENLSDPAAQVRQAMWDSAIRALRQVDPDNPTLSYASNPYTAPTQEALNRLNETLNTAAAKRVTDKVMPGGIPIGGRGSRAQCARDPRRTCSGARLI